MPKNRPRRRDVHTLRSRPFDDPARSRVFIFRLSALSDGAGTGQLAGSARVLSDRPDQLAVLAAHPELAAGAAKETMRHPPIAFSTLRIALDDVELAWVVVPGRPTAFPIEFDAGH